MESYRINILGLSLSVHQFDFELGNEFFRKYDTGALVSEGKFTVSVALDKRETFLEASFKINGFVVLVCDRSLDEFEYPVNIARKIIFKYGHENQEVSEDVMLIEHGTESLEIGQFMYEFIALAIPMKKLHPRFQNETDEDQLIYTSAPDEEKTGDGIDPRWEMLKKLNTN